jgi:hypothetical protein
MKQILISCIALLTLFAMTSANFSEVIEDNATKSMTVKIKVISNDATINNSKETTIFDWNSDAKTYDDCAAVKTHLKIRTNELKAEWLEKEKAAHPNAKITSASDDFDMTECSKGVATITINIKW